MSEAAPDPAGTDQRGARVPRRRRVLRWIRRGLLVLVIVYGVLALRYYTGSVRSPLRNYCAEFNRSIEAYSDIDRAWVSYREAALLLDELGSPGGLPDGVWRWQDVSLLEPGDATDLVLDWGDEVIELLREGSECPVLGVYWGGPDGLLINAPRSVMLADPDLDEVAADNPMLFRVDRGGNAAGALRTARVLLLGDIRRSWRQGDVERGVSGIEALASMARQCHEGSRDPMVQLSSLSLLHNACREIAWVLTAHADLLDDGALDRLERAVADADTSIDMSMFADEVDDFLQRGWTESASGDGRLIVDGHLVMIEHSNRSVGTPRKPGRLSTFPLGPITAAFADARKTLARVPRDFLDHVAGARAQAPWERAWEDPELIEKPTGIWKVLKPGRDVVDTLLPRSVGRLLEAEDRASIVRDAALLAIALERFHRAERRWPDALDELVPSYVTSVPLDQMDGSPLRFVVRDGRPMVYSVGADLDDDGGRWAEATDSRRGEPDDGDWFLVPEHRDAAPPGALDGDTDD